MTTEQENEELVREFIEVVWSEPDYELLEEIVAPDAEHSGPMDPPGLPNGPEGEKQLIQMYRQAFPDATLEVDDIVVDGDTVAARWTATGTHEGSLMGIEPTGNRVEISGSEINRIEDGQIVESWLLFDTFGMMEQIGAMP